MKTSIISRSVEGLRWYLFYLRRGERPTLSHVLSYIRCLSIASFISREYGIRLTASTPLGAMKGVYVDKIYTCHSEFLPKDDDVILDVGAQYGDYALLCAVFYKVRKVYSFEPNPVTFKILVENIEANSVSKVISADNCALADKSGTLEIAIDRDMYVKNGVLSERGDVFSIPCLSGDSLYISPTLVKIDAEGFEAEILVGLHSTLAKFRPRVIIEAHSRSLRDFCIDLLSKICYNLAHEDVPTAQGGNDTSYEGNLFFIHSGGR